MKLESPPDLFRISKGDQITKRDLYDLIQFSKVRSSSFWAGEEFSIGNTPQQGINWIGSVPQVKAVIVKTRNGSYADDGWSDTKKTAYQYSFKASKGVISYKDKANAVLINQPQYLYPIFLFTECKDGWEFEGSFSVSEIEEKYLVLKRGESTSPAADFDETEYHEGERKYVTHLLAERSKSVVSMLKELNVWTCDVCKKNFEEEYGVKYIEAHHKIPISSFSSKHPVKPSDFALLCPNCHKATHIYMKKLGIDYEQIKTILKSQLVLEK